MAFLDDKYLLTSETAQRIFSAVRDLPILDAHNHAILQEIYENNPYTDIWQVEAATDHYVWELMRKRGVPEEEITGPASNEEKWHALARVFPDFVGNPTYEWIHLDLRRRFGITTPISADTAVEIWDQTREKLQDPRMRPRALLTAMGVETMCSTDDPVDDLYFHAELAKIEGIPRIRPTWRPDKAMNIFKPDFVEYIQQLSSRIGMNVHSLSDLLAALQKTHDHFAEMGCLATDHGIEIPFGYEVTADRAGLIFQKRLAGEDLASEEVRDYMSFMLHEFGRMNAKKDWVMQIHIGAVRDVRVSLYEKLGPDVGGDVSDHLIPIIQPLKAFLNRFDGQLKVVLYSLDPNHAPTLATLTRAFGAKVNLGSAWWFNDSPVGMRRQLEYIASVDLLMNFAGMVSDSRKLMSYGSRTEMFRRVFSDVLGQMVDRRQLPEKLALRTAQYVCYEGPKQFFNF